MDFDERTWQATELCDGQRSMEVALEHGAVRLIADERVEHHHCRSPELSRRLDVGDRQRVHERLLDDILGEERKGELAGQPARKGGFPCSRRTRNDYVEGAPRLGGLGVVAQGTNDRVDVDRDTGVNGLEVAAAPKWPSCRCGAN